MKWLFAFVLFSSGALAMASTPKGESPKQTLDRVKKDVEAKFCATDVMQCPDGSFVARDPESDCAFRPCAGAAVCDPTQSENCTK